MKTFPRRRNRILSRTVVSIQRSGSGDEAAEWVDDDLWDAATPGLICGPTETHSRTSVSQSPIQERFSKDLAVTSLQLPIGGLESSATVQKRHRPCIDPKPQVS